jgi:hypothetical protein
MRFSNRKIAVRRTDRNVMRASENQRKLGCMATELSLKPSSLPVTEVLCIFASRMHVGDGRNKLGPAQKAFPAP